MPSGAKRSIAALRRAVQVGVVSALAGLSTGCNTLLNSWLDPTQVGSFFREGTLEIRSTLSIQDSPPGIPGATDPTPEDLIPLTEPYEFGPGDQVDIRILDLMVDNTETRVQVTLDEEGQVSLPVLGRLTLAGLTAREMEAEIADVLRQRGLIHDAEVVVEPVVKREQTFTIYGAIANPSLYPIIRPDFRLLEAINVAGGLVDTVTEAYVIRRARPPSDQPFARSGRAGLGPPAVSDAAAPAGTFAISDGVASVLPVGPAREEPPARPVTGPAGPEGSADRGTPSDSQPAETTPRRTDAPRRVVNGSVLETVLNRQEAQRDLIEAVVGPSAGPPPSTTPAGLRPSTEPVVTRPSTEPVVTRPSTGPVVTRPGTEPVATEPIAEEAAPTLPRFIFLNGKWIEARTPATRPPAEPERETTRPGERPAGVPPGVPRPPTEPRPEAAETQPVVDWSQIAGEIEQRIIRISAEALRDGDPRQNIVVRSGDMIRLLAGEVGEYYIMGQVNRPGAYSLTGRMLTLKMAVAAAGNIAPLGWPDRCTVYRRYGDREEMIQVNLDAIFAGKEADFFVKRDDLILVGTHPVAPFLAVIRNAFRMTYGFGFVYDRNFADIDSFGAQPNPAYRQKRFPNLFQ